MISIPEAVAAAGFLAAPWLPELLKVNLYFHFRGTSLASAFKFLCGVVATAVWTWFLVVESKKAVSSVTVAWYWILIVAVVALAGYWLLWMKYHTKTRAPSANNTMLLVIASAFVLLISGAGALAASFGALKIEMQTEKISGKIGFAQAGDLTELTRNTKIFIKKNFDDLGEGPYGTDSGGRFEIRVPRAASESYLMDIYCPGYSPQHIQAIPGAETQATLRLQR